MHTASQLALSSFSVTEAGEPVSVDNVLPVWSRSDRFGIVVDSPLGSLGATLLIQLAIARFYSVRDSSDAQPEYPEIYLFHVGGPWGDHSSFDFWPPRKEVRVLTSLDLLEAINDRGVSRLALPDGATGRVADFAQGPSTWAESTSFLSRVRSSFAYGASGRVEGFDLQIDSADPRLLENAEAILDPLEAVSDAFAGLARDPRSVLPGPSVAEDLHRWASAVRSRYPEVDPAIRAEARHHFLAHLARHGGRRTEHYRRLSPIESLALVAGLAEGHP